MKNSVKILLFLVVIFVLILLFVVGLRHVLVKKAREKITLDITTLEGQKYDAIVVLGCGVYDDGSLSPMLRYRLDQATSAFYGKMAPVIFVTGDHREGEYDEVDHMLEYFYSKGISEDWMVPDYEGQSTSLSMQHMASAGYKKVLIITQEYHLTRAMFLGENYGVDCYGLAAEDWGLSTGTIMRHTREYIATVKDFLFCKLKLQ